MQEHARRHQAALRITPAQQTFRADDLPIRYRQLGLVVQLELVGIERCTQPLLERQALGDLRVDLAAVTQKALTGLARLIQGCLGVLQQRFGVRAVLGKASQPRRDRDRDLAASDGHRPDEQGADAVVKQAHCVLV